MGDGGRGYSMETVVPEGTGFGWKDLMTFIGCLVEVKMGEEGGV